MYLTSLHNNYIRYDRLTTRASLVPGMSLLTNFLSCLLRFVLQ